MQSSPCVTPYCQRFFPTYTIKLDIPCEFIKEVDLEEREVLTQYEFKHLVEESYTHKLGYIIAIAKDALKRLTIYDGCSYIRNSYVHENGSSALNRAPNTDVFFYRLSPHKDLFTVDKPTGADTNRVEEQREARDPEPSLKFNYLCTDKDLNEWFYSFIAAHEIYSDEIAAGRQAALASEQSKIGLLYECPDLMLNKANNAVSACTKIFFARNEKEALYWYQVAAENNNADACTRVSRFYAKGIACIASQETAFKYAKKAYELTPTNLERIKVLAIRYSNGLGTEVNEEEADKLMKRYKLIEQYKSIGASSAGMSTASP
ncbi:tetratricopeptide repeat protein [Candidatus Protochlamydia phocaeensis]|uniref:tetratricopeptide repeat protein n=1 Tax=Candidatus Protochlamydia phocaeensis TaxID=1414722 RepID=UPI000837BB46|nr:sel1 repeat family protein [Candidatus Protochlamydia phocaeensis]